jgi:DNA-binding PadR family transcriptional regulator
MRELERRSGGVYRASAGTVYPTLQQLEDEGLVASETVEGRRVYRLTDRGHAELEEEAATVRRIWRRAEEWGDWSFAFEPDAAEVARPALRLLKVALRSLARDPSARRIERIREILERALREIEDLPQG